MENANTIKIEKFKCIKDFRRMGHQKN